MIDDHTSVNKSASDLVTRLKVTPEDNPTSQSLKSEGEKNLAELKALKGMAFDKAYIDHEVAYHQQVIDAIDKTLIRTPNNAELKALLVKVRPAFVSHLQHAKELQSSLNKYDRALDLVARAVTFSGVSRRLASSCASRHQAARPPRANRRLIRSRSMRPDTILEELTVNAGDTVIWVNKDLVAHTATSQAGRFDSGIIVPGKSWKYRVSRTGEFAYTCTYHPTMKATLRVK